MTHIQTHHTLKLQIKIFLKGVIHRNTSIFLSRADFTRFQCNIFLSLIQLYVFNFLNLMQGDILTKAEKHFQVLKHTSLPLPIWYQDGLTKQWKSEKLILQRKKICLYFSRWIQRSQLAPSLKDLPPGNYRHSR